MTARFTPAPAATPITITDIRAPVKEKAIRELIKLDRNIDTPASEVIAGEEQASEQVVEETVEEVLPETGSDEATSPCKKVPSLSVVVWW